jgi:hypothetical protein
MISFFTQNLYVTKKDFMKIDSLEGENRLLRLSPDEVSLEFYATASPQNDFLSVCIVTCGVSALFRP